MGATMSQTHSNKTKVNPWGVENPEKIRNNPNLDQTRKLASVFSPTGLLDQIFGRPDSTNVSPEKPVSKDSFPHKRKETLIFTYERRNSEMTVSSDNEEIRQIVRELKKHVYLLEKSEAGLVAEITKISVEQLPQKPGVYYLRFFEWLISMVKQLRSKVEEGRTWLQAMTSKKKKMGYWKMYKKHGTSFGLSNERTMATQSG